MNFHKIITKFSRIMFIIINVNKNSTYWFCYSFFHIFHKNVITPHIRGRKTDLLPFFRINLSEEMQQAASLLAFIDESIKEL